MSTAARDARRQAVRAAADVDVVEAPPPEVVPLDGALFARGLQLGTALVGGDRPTLVFVFDIDPAAGPGQTPIPPVVIDATPHLVAAVASALAESTDKAQAAFAARLAAADLERGTCDSCGTPIFGPLVEVGRCLACQANAS